MKRPFSHGPADAGPSAPAGDARPRRNRRLLGIRGKLMLFVVALCALLLGLVWVLNVQLLEPMYHRQLTGELNRVANAVTSLIEKYDTIEDPGASQGLKESFVEDMNAQAVLDMLPGKCLEVGDATGERILGTCQLAGRDCLLHPTLSFFGTQSRQWDSLQALALRQKALQDGNYILTLTKGDSSQLVVGRNVDGRYTVIVSTDLERIGQASQVIGQQMPLIAAVLLAASILCAWLFSRWFTRPLRQLSHAAREMARGNFSVRVQPTTADEIGVLAQDFNTMASEVARTYDLQRDLIANVSHDLRTPLTLIKGYAETVRDLTGDDKHKRDDQLNIIIDESDRLRDLVNSVMELSKYSSGTMPMNPVTFDLAQLCDEVAERYENVCAQEGYHLEVRTDTSCPVYADPDSLQRVVHNLLSNAIHHVGSDGYVALRVLPLPGGRARVEVEDHGSGISAEDLPHIFDKYYRARADAGKTGTGLGLSITKAILVAHGYAFGVQSEPGTGSLFWFETKPAGPDAGEKKEKNA